MRDIKMAKEADAAKAKEKAERAKLNGEEEVKEENKSAQIANAAQNILDKRAGVKKKNEPEIDEAANEERRLAALEEEERKTYGRYDVWLSYYNPQNAELW